MFKFRIGTSMLLFFSIGITVLSSKYNKATEIIFSNIINKFFREKLSIVFEQIPFPVGSIIEVVLMIIFLYYVLKIITAILHPRKVFSGVYKTFWGVVNVFSIVFFIYLMIFGLNFRTPLLGDSLIMSYNKRYETNIQVNVDNVKRAEVFEYIEKKAVEARKIALSSGENSFSNISDIPYDQAEDGFRAISEVFPRMEGKFSSAKHTNMDFSYEFLGLDGRYFIFTNEIAINRDIPKIYKPFVLSKLMAYQRGIVREDEANFFAYMACINNSDSLFRYSGYISMLQILSESMSINDRIEYNNFLERIDPNIKKDLSEIDNHKLSHGAGKNYVDRFKYIFRRINGDIRVDDIPTQTSNLLSIYYSLNTYE